MRVSLSSSLSHSFERSSSFLPPPPPPIPPSPLPPPPRGTRKSVGVRYEFKNREATFATILSLLCSPIRQDCFFHDPSSRCNIIRCKTRTTREIKYRYSFREEKGDQSDCLIYVEKYLFTIINFAIDFFSFKSYSWLLNYAQ